MMVISGAIHAAVNAAFKSGGDKMSSRALLDGFSGLLLLPAVFIAPLPAGAWVWLAASGVVHFVYLFALIRAFGEPGDPRLPGPARVGRSWRRWAPWSCFTNRSAGRWPAAWPWSPPGC